jgi:hypothetical protein
LNALAGVRRAERIHVLDSEGTIVDLSPLRGRTFDTLILSRNAITDARPLRDVTVWRQLGLMGNPIAYPAWPRAPAAAGKRVKLDVSGRGYTDLAGIPVAAVGNLGLHGTAVSDLQACADMPQLEGVSLEGTPVRDLGPLRGRELRHLGLSGTALADQASVEQVRAELRPISRRSARRRAVALESK